MKFQEIVCILVVSRYRCYLVNALIMTKSIGVMRSAIEYDGVLG